MINCSGTEAGGILDSDKTKGSEQIQNKTILALGEGVCLQMKKKRFKGKQRREGLVALHLSCRQPVCFLCSQCSPYRNLAQAWVLSHFGCVWLFAIPWTVARQAPLSMGFSRQEYGSGLPCPSPGDLPDPGIEPRSPALQADSLPSEPPRGLVVHI